MKYIAILHGTPANWDIQRKPHFGGGDSSPTSSTTTNTIPEELKPLAALYTNQATGIAGTPYESYNDQRYADLNSTQNSGIGMVQDLALNGDPTFNNAEANLNQMMSGTENPYLDAMVNKSLQATMGNSIGASALSGSFGNSGIAEATAQLMGNQANSMYGDQYQFDQGQRMSAIGMAPTFANQQYDNAESLINAGNILQGQEQQGLDFNYEQFTQAQDYPYKQLQATGSVLQGNMGTNTTQSDGGGGK